ncbi:MAG: hypothetical protein ACJA1L_000554 [Paracoccaceae bacterium]|jgi:hypothetical protein
MNSAAPDWGRGAQPYRFSLGSTDSSLGNTIPKLVITPI